MHRLGATAFWFGNPRLLLWAIRLLMFLTSFVFSNAAFHASQFGAHSCFFSRSGFQGLMVQWWLVMLANGLLCGYLAFTTLPLYSLAVQMHPTTKRQHLTDYLRDGLQQRFVGLVERGAVGGASVTSAAAVVVKAARAASGEV